MLSCDPFTRGTVPRSAPVLTWSGPDAQIRIRDRCRRPDPMRHSQMTLAEVRQFALLLPETTEQPHFEMTSFRVNGKIFATAPPEGDRVHIFVDEEHARSLAVEQPAVFEELW